MGDKRLVPPSGVCVECWFGADIFCTLTGAVQAGTMVSPTASLYQILWPHRGFRMEGFCVDFRH